MGNRGRRILGGALLAAALLGAGALGTRGQAPQWAYSETFAGQPAAPHPFSAPNLQYILTGDDNGFIDGQVVDEVTQTDVGHVPIQAGHGPHCEPPLAGAANNHTIPLGNPADLVGYQRDIRPQFMYTCADHMMTAVHAGYAVLSFMPRQLFDWQGRTGTLEIESSIYTAGREWWDVYLVPQDEMLLDIQHLNEGGTGEQMPRRAVRFSTVGNTPAVALIDNYQIVDEWRSGLALFQQNPVDPAMSDPRPRRLFHFEVNNASWAYQIQRQDGTFLSYSGVWSQPLTFSRALARVEHHSYNPTKDGLHGDPWSQFTYHWRNLRFDGPVLGDRTAYLPGPHFIDLRYASAGQVSPPITINVPGGAASASLIGVLAGQLLNDDVDPLNTARWREVRLNGGPWLDVPLIKNVHTGTNERGWSTFRVPLSNVVAGANTIQFRYRARPPQASWQPDGFRVHELELQVDGGAPGPTATAFPTATLAPTLPPVPSATAVPPATRTPTPQPGTPTRPPASPTRTPTTSPPTATPLPACAVHVQQAGVEGLVSKPGAFCIPS